MANGPFVAFQSLKIERGLALEERKGHRTYYARASVNGKQFYRNTETRDFGVAKRDALSWFRNLKRGDLPDASSALVTAAATLYLNRIEKPSKRDNATERWNGIKGYWKGVEVRDVTPKRVRAFMDARRAASIKAERSLSASTLHKDLVVLRQILKTAVEEEWIPSVPAFPSPGEIVPNPRPWLTPEELDHLMDVAQERLEAVADNERLFAQRSELRDFIQMMIATCARVDEVRNIRAKDCQRKEHPKRPGVYYMEIWVDGKTGRRKVITLDEAATIVHNRLTTETDRSPDDLLFHEHHRDGFRELLIAAGLRYDAAGRPRNLKALRSTALSLRILRNPRINLKLLATNAGTSVAMLDQFYLKRLTVDIGIDELMSGWEYRER